MNVTYFLEEGGAVSVPPDGAMSDFIPSTLPAEVDVFIGAYLIVCFLLSMVLNCLVTVTIVNRPKKEPLDGYILVLVLTELLQTLGGFPPVILASFSHGWGLGQKWCDYQATVVFICGLVSLWTLTMTSIARFLKTFFASYFSVYCRRVSMMAAVQISLVLVVGNSLAWSLSPLLGVGAYSLEDFHLSCGLDWTSTPLPYICALLTVNYILPVSIMVVSYVSMVTKSCILAGKCPSDGRTHRRDLYFTKMACLMCGAFILSWSPYAFVSMFYVTRNAPLLPEFLTVSAPLLAKSSTWLNSVIYFYVIKRLRSDVIKYGFFCGCAFQHDEQHFHIRCLTEQGQVLEMARVPVMSHDDAVIDIVQTESRETRHPNCDVLETHL